MQSITRTCNKSKRNLVLGTSALAALLLLGLPVKADEFTDSDDNRARTGTVVSNEAINIGTSNAGSLALRAEEMMKDGYTDKAIALFKEALDKDNEDTDIHVGYAKALERKLYSQKSKDPALFSEVVEEWLNILRSKYGEEGGTTFHGISILNINASYSDEDRQLFAKNHLKKVAGDMPRPWETNDRFLKRVMSKNVVGNIVVSSDSDKPVKDNGSDGAKEASRSTSKETQ